MDQVSDDQRRYGASLLLIRGRFEAAISRGPVILTGDFNSSSTGTDSGTYQIVTGKLPPVKVDKKFAVKYSPRGEVFPDFKFLDT
jgi:endonuclease/exonuclease/phosphatase family metal-dependent hydrolase